MTVACLPVHRSHFGVSRAGARPARRPVFLTRCQDLERHSLSDGPHRPLPDPAGLPAWRPCRSFPPPALPDPERLGPRGPSGPAGHAASPSPPQPTAHAPAHPCTSESGNPLPTQQPQASPSARVIGACQPPPPRRGIVAPGPRLCKRRRLRGRGRGGTPVGCGRTATKRELPRGAEAVGRPDGMGLHKAEGDRRGGTGTKRELSRGDNHLSLIPEGTEWNGTGLYRTGLTGTTRTSASCRSCLAQPRPKRAPPCPPAGGVTVGRPPPGRRPLVIRALTGRVGGREAGRRG